MVLRKYLKCSNPSVHVPSQSIDEIGNTERPAGLHTPDGPSIADQSLTNG
jgi:hypothetical protein